MKQHKHFEIHQFIANFLAKFKDAYKVLELGNQSETHQHIAKIYELDSQSFQMLRSEYDGFYEVRKGFPNPYKRKSRVEYKERFENLDFEAYSKRVKKLLLSQSTELYNSEEINSILNTQ